MTWTLGRAWRSSCARCAGKLWNVSSLPLKPWIKTRSSVFFILHSSLACLNFDPKDLVAVKLLAIFEVGQSAAEVANRAKTDVFIGRGCFNSIKLQLSSLRVYLSV